MNKPIAVQAGQRGDATVWSCHQKTGVMSEIDPVD